MRLFGLALKALDTDNDSIEWGHKDLADEALGLVAAKLWSVDQEDRALALDEEELIEALDDYSPPFCRFSVLRETREWGFWVDLTSLEHAAFNFDGVAMVQWTDELNVEKVLVPPGIDYFFMVKDDGDAMLWSVENKAPAWGVENYSAKPSAHYYDGSNSVS